jgi:hypothetical protein
VSDGALEEIGLHCPVGPRQLLAKLRLDGGRPRYVDGSLIELACSDCRRTRRRQGLPPVAQVLHRFDVLGVLVETVLVPYDEGSPV